MKKIALVCKPAKTIGKGLRLKDTGDPDFEKTKLQHSDYMNALKNFGYELITMPPCKEFPDSVFVEDPAIIISDTLIITRLRSPKRSGEEAKVLNALLPYFNKIFQVPFPGFIEGGDVLIANQKIYIGLSGRTDQNGADGLAKIARDHSRFSHIDIKIFEIPKNWLHLKGGVSYHKNNVITASENIARHFESSGSRLIVTPGDERFGANCISEGTSMLVHKDRKKTKAIIEKAGFTTKEIDLSEYDKIDGAMTCLSKLFLR